MLSVEKILSGKSKTIKIIIQVDNLTNISIRYHGQSFAFDLSQIPDMHDSALREFRNDVPY